MVEHSGDSPNDLWYSSDTMKTWTNEQFIAACKNNVTIAGVLRDIGLSVRPGNYGTAHKYIELLGIDTSHFTGRASGNGGKKASNLADILVENSTYNRWHLKQRLLREGILENKCDICGLDGEWRDNKLVMVLDHINGINNDHRLENLRMLCPNCNSQQDTFCR